MNRQPLPKLMVRPYYCVAMNGQRMLPWGVYETRAAALERARWLCRGPDGFDWSRMSVQRIHVSRVTP